MVPLQYEDAERRIRELEIAVTERDSTIAGRDATIAEREAVIAGLKLQLAALEQKVKELTERVSQDSTNSHLPPSTDAPGKRTGKKGKSSRHRGGQPGHPGRRRKLLPAAQVDAVVNLFPEACENCWRPLAKTVDPEARRHQVTEVPVLKPKTTEYREHAVNCLHCGYPTRAKLDPSISCSMFGPRLSAMVALLTGMYHISRRQTVRLLSDLLGVEMSLGSVSVIEHRVSQGLAAPAAEVLEKVCASLVKHTDGTSWRQSGAGLQLWTIASSVGTAFKILKDGTSASLKSMFIGFAGILVSDRAKALLFWSMDRRQICWSHLVRKFRSFSQRDGPAARMGLDLLQYTGIIFSYWHAYKDGRQSRSDLQRLLKPVREQVETLLEKAAATQIPQFSASCADILVHREALWTFVDHEGVEPTNNHAEQEIRGFVLWRKRSFGSQSDRGNEFAERIMTITHTARKQRRHVLTFVTECFAASLHQDPAPSLFPSSMGK